MYYAVGLAARALAPAVLAILASMDDLWAASHARDAVKIGDAFSICRAVRLANPKASLLQERVAWWLVLCFYLFFYGKLFVMTVYSPAATDDVFDAGWSCQPLAVG